MKDLAKNVASWLYRAYWNIAGLLRLFARRWGYLLLAGLLGLGLFFTRQYWMILLQAPVENRTSAAGQDIEVSMWAPNRIQPGENGETQISFAVQTLPTTSQGRHVVSVTLSSPDTAVYFKPSTTLIVELDRDVIPKPTRPLTVTIGYGKIGQPSTQFSVLATVNDGPVTFANLQSTVGVDLIRYRVVTPISTALQSIALVISILVGIKNLFTRKI